ncbi:hypothetical protein ScPMuIL_012360 [Solemya velum]
MIPFIVKCSNLVLSLGLYQLICVSADHESAVELDYLGGLQTFWEKVLTLPFYLDLEWPCDFCQDVQDDSGEKVHRVCRSLDTAYEWVEQNLVLTFLCISCVTLTILVLACRRSRGENGASHVKKTSSLGKFRNIFRKQGGKKQRQAWRRFRRTSASSGRQILGHAEIRGASPETHSLAESGYLPLLTDQRDLLSPEGTAPYCVIPFRRGRRKITTSHKVRRMQKLKLKQSKRSCIHWMRKMKLYLQKSGTIPRKKQILVNSHCSRAELNLNENCEILGIGMREPISVENSNSVTDMKSEDNQFFVTVNTNCNRRVTLTDTGNNYLSNISDSTEIVNLSPCHSVKPDISRKIEMGVDNVDTEPEVETAEAIPESGDNGENHSEANDFYNKLMDYLGEPRDSSSVCDSDDGEVDGGVGLESLVHDSEMREFDGVIHRTDLDSEADIVPTGGDTPTENDILDGTFSDIANVSQASMNSRSVLDRSTSQNSSLDVSSLNRSLVFYSSEAQSPTEFLALCVVQSVVKNVTEMMWPPTALDDTDTVYSTDSDMSN